VADIDPLFVEDVVEFALVDRVVGVDRLVDPLVLDQGRESAWLSVWHIDLPSLPRVYFRRSIDLNFENFDVARELARE
jgi:hypothetical protein